MGETYDTTAEAQRLLDVIDSRIAKAIGSQVERTWGTVAAVNEADHDCDVYLYGQTVASSGFRWTNGIKPKVGDRVGVAILREKDDRWVDEVIAPSAYDKVAISLTDGTIKVGDGTAPASTPVGTDLVAAHAAAADPHTGYQKESEKGAANGYVGMDAGRAAVAPGGLVAGDGFHGEGTIELRSPNPFIDFKTDAAHDYGARFLYDYNDDGKLEVNFANGGVGMDVNGTLAANRVSIGANPLARYVPFATPVFTSGTTTSTIARTRTPEIVALPTNALAVSVRMAAAGPAGSAGRFQLYHYNSADLVAECFPGSTGGVGYYSASAGTFILLGGTNNRQFDYAVTIPGSGTTTYICFVVGYWTVN